jgi:hypothetical protein
MIRGMVGEGQEKGQWCVQDQRSSRSSERVKGSERSRVRGSLVQEQRMAGAEYGEVTGEVAMFIAGAEKSRGSD